MYFTFLKDLPSMEVSVSLYNEEGVEMVPRLMEKAEMIEVKLYLPSDFATESSRRTPTSGTPLSPKEFPTDVGHATMSQVIPDSSELSRIADGGVRERI